MSGARCKDCFYRARESSVHLCDYASMTGHTRKAQPPEKCTYYQKECRPREAGKAAGRQQHDWAGAMALWKAGKTDPEIAKAIGVGRQSVRNWRMRNSLSSNWNREKENGGLETAKKEKRGMRKETKDRILRMLREDAERRKDDLDRALLQGQDGKRELERYREALLARDDFEEGVKGTAAG